MQKQKKKCNMQNNSLEKYIRGSHRSKRNLQQPLRVSLSLLRRNGELGGSLEAGKKGR
jgi:hypothetical protein